MTDTDKALRAREQAGGLDHWANVLEAHEPKASAAGIVMLRAAAKTLRELTVSADSPEGPNIFETVKIVHDWIDGLLDEDCERIAAASAEGMRLLLHQANERLLPPYPFHAQGEST